MSTITRKTFCRYCHAYCPMEVDVQNGRAVEVRPDRDNALYGGYTCVKGRQLVEQMYQPERLLSPQKRGPAGFAPIGSAAALDEIAAHEKAEGKRPGDELIARAGSLGAQADIQRLEARLVGLEQSVSATLSILNQLLQAVRREPPAGDSNT